MLIVACPHIYKFMHVASVLRTADIIEYIRTMETVMTPKDLARELGYNDDGRAVRRLLRQGFPDHPKHARWEPLTPGQIGYVRERLPSCR